MSEDVKPNGVECNECGHTGRTKYFGDCPMDDGEGEPHWVTPVFIEPCPNGVTRADWLAPHQLGDLKCDSDVHQWSTGEHVTQPEV